MASKFLTHKYVWDKPNSQDSYYLTFTGIDTNETVVVHYVPNANYLSIGYTKNSLITKFHIKSTKEAEVVIDRFIIATFSEQEIINNSKVFFHKHKMNLIKEMDSDHYFEGHEIKAYEGK